MLLMPKRDQPLDRLANRIAVAAEPSCSLVEDVAVVFKRLALLKGAGKTGHFDACCRSGAFVDAAFALVAQELPDWSVRRIVWDSGLWFCALSRAPNLPTELDEVVEASHEDMALAIFSAFVDAKRVGKSATSATRTVPAINASSCFRICCDNFS